MEGSHEPEVQLGQASFTAEIEWNSVGEQANQSCYGVVNNYSCGGEIRGVVQNILENLGEGRNILEGLCGRTKYFLGYSTLGGTKPSFVQRVQ